jgi:hypothetical protein
MGKVITSRAFSIDPRHNPSEGIREIRKCPKLLSTETLQINANRKISREFDFLPGRNRRLFAHPPLTRFSHSTGKRNR